MRPGPEPGLRHGEAAALLAEQVVVRHPDVLEDDLRVAAGVVVAEDVRLRPKEMPGVSFGTTIIDCWRWAEALGSVLPMTMNTLQRSARAPELNHFVPLSTYCRRAASMRRPNVGGVRDGGVGFGHAERRADLALEQRRQPVLLDRSEP